MKKSRPPQEIGSMKRSAATATSSKGEQAVVIWQQTKLSCAELIWKCDGPASWMAKVKS